MAATRPFIALPGRRADAAEGLRTEVVAVGARYAEAIERAGGQPILLPRFSAQDDDGLRVQAMSALLRVDALVMIGGADIDPARYGEPRHEKTAGVDAHQDAFEFALLQAALDIGLPVLAICRGMQALNVVLGGSLLQHLPDDPSRDAHRKVHHEVHLADESLVARAVGSLDVCGHSLHHQAVAHVGAGLRVTGRTTDGTIEAIELERGWVVGVQWHPEDTAAHDPQQSALFTALVREAAARDRGSARPSPFAP
jgi:putative glutamine amidotransferase